MSGEIEDLVEIELSETYSDILGPPGARGMPETGHLIEPRDLSPNESDQAMSAILREADLVGLKLQKKEREQKSRVQRYDFGSVTEVAKWLSAVGAGGLVLRLLSKADAHITIWLKNRASRSVTIKKGDWTVTAKGDVDVREIIKQLENSHMTPHTPAQKRQKNVPPNTTAEEPGENTSK
jgi:hypothetical protein